MPDTTESTDEIARAKSARQLTWVVALSALALMFDGYDLVVYGTVLPTLMADPSQIGQLSAGQAGTLGSYALVGVLVGALSAGAVSDRIGRRKVVLASITWFSLGMAATALAQSIAVFGILRFLTGIGLGAILATVGALVAELAPPERKNRLNAIVYSGIPAGGVSASLMALIIDPSGANWRILMAIGASPLVLLLPFAIAKLPESQQWLDSRGQVAPVTGPVAQEAVGFSALARRPLAFPTLVLGLMSFSGLLLTYGLNTWLPKIMEDNGYGKAYALTFLLVLNGGAIVGGLLASFVADRTGARKVVATTFVLAGLMLVLLPLGLPLAVLFPAVAIAGVGTIGTQVLIYGLVANYYPTRARGAGVAWCAGFGRLGGIVGPIIGGALVAAGVGGTTAFQIFAGVAIVGAVVTAAVPRSPEEPVVDVALDEGLPA
ncbi:AAHS family benzoate transporter-like MFS transporter [Nocardioides luteus]|uniref:Benzoate transporter n=1 Tax=Nocardioides luteus TaxID=1844 RepID=A0ABQ5SX77_9ACTN|nr:aromatic acid/H+ symport family MFS transporter [Nocardioides luteus]MDR7311859.1 AAHS family benzoate transporter-like MFS transporter [Nocardioides luteus]GGR66824.1 benzoate transporter [Nocardioides luteus]GLJ68102.1 benzoate transporter [Nocardioides luteus]